MRVLSNEAVCLMHYVELSAAGWWETTVEHCALAALWMLQEPVNTRQIGQRIEEELGISIRTQELRSPVKKGEKEGTIIRLPDGRYHLSVDKHREFAESATISRKREEYTKERFVQQMEEHDLSVDPADLWQLFLEHLLIPLVTYLGARFYEVVTGTRKIDSEHSYLRSFYEQVPADDREKVKKAINSFIAARDPQIEAFLLSYLDAYFLLTASGLPRGVLQALRALRPDKIDFSVVVDTNFVFSILGLHSNPSNQAAEDLMNIVRSTAGDLKFQFLINHRTLEETQRSIRRHKKELGSGTYPPNVARAGTQTDVYGVYETFFNRVSQAGHPISAEDYFAPYETELVRLLAEKGVAVLPDNRDIPYENTLQVIEDVERQREYELGRWGEDAKTEHQLRHDIVLWNLVQDLREWKVASPLEAKWWIVTVDYRFIGYDQYKTRDGRLLPVCLDPSQLIQILRFFVPRSKGFEQALLSAIRLPGIARSFDSLAEQTNLRILRRMARHEGIGDLDDSTLLKTLQEEVVRNGYSRSDLSEEEEIELVESSLARQLVEKNELVERQELVIGDQASEIADLKERIGRLEENLEGSQDRERQKNRQLAVVEAEKRATEHEVEELTKEVHDVQRQFARITRIMRIVAALVVATSGICAVLFGPKLIGWSWILQHPRKLGLQILGCLIVGGIVWMIVDSRRWLWALATLIIGSILVVAQII